MKFSERLRLLGFETYKEYLESDLWKAFRARYRESGRRMTCQVCSKSKVQLHHHTYVRLGNERLSDVVPLCRAHHEAVHEWLKSTGKFFVRFTNEAVLSLGGEAIPSRRRKKPRRSVRKANKIAKAKARREPTEPVENYLTILDGMSLSENQKRQIQKDRRHPRKLRGLVACYSGLTRYQKVTK